jgi:UPF0042 nucleotide-binding protein
VALGVDIRGGKLFDDMEGIFHELREKGYHFEILFLDAADEVLIHRFKETRRTHPLSKTEPVNDSIQKEREILSRIRLKADFIVDTSDLLTRQLKERINDLFLYDKQYNNLSIKVLSFGYKYGVPPECDLVMDVRFIPNPFYVAELKHKTGNDKEVYDYVMSKEAVAEFIEKFKDMLAFLLPNYIKEGKNSLVIGIGCTGGKHRSVTIARVLNNDLRQSGYFTVMAHRDLLRE